MIAPAEGTDVCPDICGQLPDKQRQAAGLAVSMVALTSCEGDIEGAARAVSTAAADGDLAAFGAGLSVGAAVLTGTVGWVQTGYGHTPATAAKEAARLLPLCKGQEKRIHGSAADVAAADRTAVWKTLQRPTLSSMRTWFSSSQGMLQGNKGAGQITSNPFPSISRVLTVMRCRA